MSNGNGLPRTAVKVSLGDCESYKCPECSGDLFYTLFILKTIPALLSQSGKEELVNLETFFCNSCDFNTGILKRG